MKVLFIGGSGVISTASTRLAVDRGLDLWLLNRGKSASPIGNVQTITADINDPASARTALSGHSWDAVVQWIAFSPADIERDIELFRGKTKQYIFISSASVYEKPPSHYLITESTPRVNPYWEYSRQKIASEERLLRAFREEAFPGVIVRPSLTYGDTLIPLAINSWQKSWTAVDRLRRGLPVIVPGDGTSLWTVTHNSDFALGMVGLLGSRESLGNDFHITSDEVLTWNDIYLQTAHAAGVEQPRLIHIASDFITACLPGEIGSLHGDKSASAVFDNTKIKKLVPNFLPRMTYSKGIEKTLSWFKADPSRQQIDEPANKIWDKIIHGYEQGLQTAKQELL
jgi:nucleoside-diphosphate-sugar epimerase